MDTIVNVTITTSLTMLIILSIKALIKNKISPKGQFALWIIIALRLLVPVLPESKASIFNVVPQVKNIEVSKEAIGSIIPETKTYIKGDIIVGEKDKEFVLSKSLVDNIALVWILGAIIIFSYFVASYFIYNKKTKKFNKLEDKEMLLILENCKESLNIKRKIQVKIGGETPLIKGVFKPEIILPKGYTKEELKGIFMHELTHYKHKDILLNIISTWLLCVYWYNPIMWFGFSVFKRDMEILCDYRVLEVYKNKKEYAEILLKTALRKNRFLLCSTSMQNGEKDVTRRIKHIAYFKKPRFFWSSVFIVIAIIIAAVCLTNPKGNDLSANSGDLDYKKIYEYKTLYVGDASKVGNITDRLYYGEYKKGFELHTESEPFGATIRYSVKGEDLSPTDEMMKNAAIMFCLIDNVDTINFRFDTGEEAKTFSFNRSAFEHVLNEDLREYSTTFEKFNKEFIPLIENQNWGIKKSSKDSANNIGEEVEKRLEEIISSPKSSSNPDDYIKSHDREYEDILKMGDDALNYMLSVFESGEAKGIKAHIMMSLCIDLLGDRNNVKEGSYSSPQEWYAKLSPYTASKLEPFKYETEDKIEQMVYSAAIDRYSKGRGGVTQDDSVTIVAPHVFGTHESNNELKIFTTVYYNGFKLYDKTLSGYSGGIVPAAIVYRKNNDGSYTFKEYIEARGGEEFTKSIKSFCKPRGDIADEIIKHYGKYDDLFQLMNENLIKYLKENKMEGINLKERGEIIPLT